MMLEERNRTVRSKARMGYDGLSTNVLDVFCMV